MKEAFKSLWRLCFNDSETFIELYFRLRYREEEMVAIRKDHQIVSALQMIPYPMTYGTHLLQMAYISGACTHPQYRKQSLMEQVLTDSFQEMYREGVDLTTLIPANASLFDYYARMGYATVFYQSTEQINEEVLLTSHVKIEHTTTNEEGVYDYLSTHLAKRTCCVQHTSSDFEIILSDLALGSGTLFYATEAHQIKGVAIVYNNGEVLHIEELVADHKVIELALIQAIKQKNTSATLQIKRPAQNRESSIPFAMARIIHAKSMLEVYAETYPTEAFKIKLTDSLLPDNNGYYEVRNGQLIHQPDSGNSDYEDMDIATLTRKLLQRLNPYMSLMMN